MNNIPSDDELKEKITEAKSETKEEILTYLRDCAENIGCSISESRALNKAADNIEKHIGDRYERT
ncbi:MAG: hypothetical protein KAT62_03585 [Desulfuromonadales bacterium]|nr:hypothetical protein [Desulfuromonadales bacterium]